MKNVLTQTVLFIAVILFSLVHTFGQCSNAGIKNGTSFTHNNSIAGYSFSSLSNLGLPGGAISEKR
ncbi:MAG: hypothetical protein ABIR18_04840 [Chitinophagaceae bacterium]